MNRIKSVNYPLMVGGGGPEQETRYPVLGQYIHLFSAGFPFVDASFGPINQGQINIAAKMDYLNLGQGLNTPIDDQIRAAIRSANPKIRIIDYFNCGRAPLSNPGSTNFDQDKWDTIGGNAGLIWTTDDNAFDYFGSGGVDYAQAGIPEDMAALVADWFSRDPLAYGVFCDETSRGITWMPDYANIDVAESGSYANLTEWDIGYVAGIDTFYATLRALVPSHKLVLGNGGIAGPVGHINGWMRENWPDQGTPATIQKYVDDCGTAMAPKLYQLTTFKNAPLEPHTPPYTPATYSTTDKLQGILVLGVSCLGAGFGTLVGGTNDPSRSLVSVWLDEFSVIDGVATTSLDGKGWLGRRLTVPAVDVTGVWFSEFENGMVVCNDTGTTQAFTPPGGPSTYKRILGDSAVGNNGAIITTTVSIGNRRSIFLWRL